jgi:hypothetical protein
MNSTAQVLANPTRPTINEALSADFEIMKILSIRVENSDEQNGVIGINLENGETLYIGNHIEAADVIDGVPYFRFFEDEALEYPVLSGCGSTGIRYFNLVEQKLL